MTDMLAKLDEFGRPAWIALMVVGFILFWPVGLGILAYLIWSGRMGRMSCGQQRGFGRWHGANEHEKGRGRGAFRGPFASTGNYAFDEYREETLRRLEEEQKEFSAYLDRLRHAKDKAEFDQFMSERRERPVAVPGTEAGGDAPRLG